MLEQDSIACLSLFIWIYDYYINTGENGDASKLYEIDNLVSNVSY